MTRRVIMVGVDLARPTQDNDIPVMLFDESVDKEIQRVFLWNFDWVNDELHTRIMSKITEVYGLEKCHGWVQKYSTPEAFFTIFEYDYDGE